MAWKVKCILKEFQQSHKWEELRRLGTRESKKEAKEIQMEIPKEN